LPFSDPEFTHRLKSILLTIKIAFFPPNLTISPRAAPPSNHAQRIFAFSDG
jgi:hypothetical protein